MRTSVHTDGFKCNCRYCIKFYKKIHRKPKLESVLRLPPPDNGIVKEERIHYVDNVKHWIKIGDRVIAQDKFTGVVQYVGPLDHEVLNPGLYVGVRLDEPRGLHAGIVNGKRYFTSPLGCGLMVKYDQVKKAKPADRRPPVYGNKMFPSYQPNMYRDFVKTLSANCNNSNSRNSNKQTQCNSSVAKPTGKSKTTATRKLQTNKDTQQLNTKETSKRLPIKTRRCKSADPLPTRLQQEASQWTTDKSIAQPQILRTTLTKLYLAKEIGRLEMKESEQQEEKRCIKEDVSRQDKEGDELKYGARTSNWKLSDSI